jgi:hypothetical protein
MPVGKPATRAVSRGMADANARLHRAAAAQTAPETAEAEGNTDVVGAPVPVVPPLEPAIKSRVRPLQNPSSAAVPAAPTVPLPLAHRVDEHNADIRRRLSVIESMQQRQWQALLELGHLLRQELGVEIAVDSEEPYVDEDGNESTVTVRRFKRVPSPDGPDALTDPDAVLAEGNEFGGVAAGDDVETTSEDLGGETTSEDVPTEPTSE